MQDIDLVKEIQNREQQIAKLREEVEAIKKVAEMFGLISEPSASSNEVEREFNIKPNSEPRLEVNGEKKQKFGFLKWGKPLGDFLEEMLRDKENGLHLNEIHQRLIAKGINTTLGSVDAALRKDTKQRFKLVAARTYSLAKKSAEVAI